VVVVVVGRTGRVVVVAGAVVAGAVEEAVVVDGATVPAEPSSLQAATATRMSIRATKRRIPAG
jgi:hypothetical protein